MMRTILNCLIDKYEKSKNFVENNKKIVDDNKIPMKISVKINKLFPNYEDEEEYKLFIQVNTAVDALALKEYITVTRKKNGLIDSLVLNPNKLEEIYLFLSRKPKSETNQQILKLLKKYR